MYLLKDVGKNTDPFKRFDKPKIFFRQFYILAKKNEISFQHQLQGKVKASKQKEVCFINLKKLRILHKGIFKNSLICGTDFRYFVAV